MLTFDDLKSYFEKFFTNYGPYRSNKVYSIIIDTLIKNYFNDSYNQIPATFKSAFEQQKIPIEFYDNILLSVGFTIDILNKISYKDKEILLKTFTDFNIYKGTLNQIQKVASDFEEDLNLYELLIDFRTVLIPYYFLMFLKNQDYVIAENEFIYDSIKINDYIQVPGDSNSYRVVLKKEDNKIYIDKPFDFDVIVELINSNNEFIIANTVNYDNDSISLKNINIDRWVFVPDLIYSGEKVKNKVLKTFLDYDKIYNNTKKYFISIEYLEDNKESLLLPIKSNLILLDYKKFREINLLNYLFAAIVLKEYRKARMVLYFKDGKYITNLERIYKLWYYIIFKFYNKGVSTNGLPNPALIFSIDSPFFDLQVSDINSIKLEYDKIKTRYEYELFYTKYFKNKLSPLSNYATDIPIEQFKLLIENEVGKDLVEYVDSRIINAKGIDSEFECNFILDEIYSSIITWSFGDDAIKNNISYLLDSLSYISTSVEFSPSYNLILFLKPFHVELIKELDEILEINDKSDLVNPFHKFKYFIKVFNASLLNISHSLFKSKILLNINDSAIIQNSFKNNILYKSKSLLNLLDNFKQELTYFEESVSFQNHKDLFKLKLIIYSFVHSINEIVLNIIQNNKDNNDIIDYTKLILGGEFESSLVISNKVISDLKSKYFSNSIVTIEPEYEIVQADIQNLNLEHIFTLNDNLMILIRKLIFNLQHVIRSNIEFIDVDSSGRNTLDIFDFELNMIDTDSSGKNILDSIDLDLTINSGVPILFSHSINYVT